MHRTAGPLVVVFLIAALAIPVPALAARQTPIVEVEATGVALPGIGTEQSFGAGNLPDQIRAYRSSGAWNRQITQIDRMASRYLRRHVRDSRRPAIVLDIDDTSLSNWPFWSQDAIGFDYAKAAELVRWLQSGQDPPIVQTRALYRLAHRLNVATFFVTGRSPIFEDATRANLARAGYGGRYTLFLRPASDTAKSVVLYKSSTRCKIERRGFEILLNVGDQYSDLEGGCANRAFKIPNPMYFLP